MLISTRAWSFHSEDVFLISRFIFLATSCNNTWQEGKDLMARKPRIGDLCLGFLPSGNSHGFLPRGEAQAGTRHPQGREGLMLCLPLGRNPAFSSPWQEHGLSSSLSRGWWPNAAEEATRNSWTLTLLPPLWIAGDWGGMEPL